MCYSVCREEELTTAGHQPSWEESEWPQVTHHVAPRALSDAVAGREGKHLEEERGTWQLAMQAACNHNTRDASNNCQRPIRIVLRGNTEQGVLRPGRGVW